MNNLKSVLLIAVLFLGMNAFAGNEKAVIKTSAQCEKCEANISKTLDSLPGVTKYNLSLDSKELVVKFDDEATNLATIKKAINNAGYWADGDAPNRDAYKALEACCKPKTPACCASKTSCSKDGAKKECSKDEKKECSKDSAKKECTKDGAKKECTKDGEKKEGEKSSCGHAH